MLACSVLIGAGAAVLWNAQAGYLLGNSSSETVGMLSGLVLLPSSYSSLLRLLLLLLFLANFLITLLCWRTSSSPVATTLCMHPWPSISLFGNHGLTSQRFFLSLTA